MKMRSQVQIATFPHSTLHRSHPQKSETAIHTTEQSNYIYSTSRKLNPQCNPPQTKRKTPLIENELTFSVDVLSHPFAHAKRLYRLSPLAGKNRIHRLKPRTSPSSISGPMQSVFYDDRRTLARNNARYPVY